MLNKTNGNFSRNANLLERFTSVEIDSDLVRDVHLPGEFAFVLLVTAQIDKDPRRRCVGVESVRGKGNGKGRTQEKANEISPRAFRFNQ